MQAAEDEILLLFTGYNLLIDVLLSPDNMSEQGLEI